MKFGGSDAGPASTRNLCDERSPFCRLRKSIDWQFKFSANDETWTINLEVKRIISSIGAKAYGKEHYFFQRFEEMVRLTQTILA